MIRSTPFLVLVPMIAGGAHAEPPEGSGQSETNKQIVREYMKAIDSFDLPLWERCFPDSIRFNGSAVPPEAIYGILVYFRESFPDLGFHILGQIAEGDRVATWGMFRGTHRGDFDGIPATQKRVEWFGVAIDRIEDGKVVEMWHEMDTWGLAQKLRGDTDR